jgi:hypothetical protein
MNESDKQMVIAEYVKSLPTPRPPPRNSTTELGKKLYNLEPLPDSAHYFFPEWCVVIEDEHDS